MVMMNENEDITNGDDEWEGERMKITKCYDE